MTFVSFNPFELLVWIAATSFLPGVLLALGIFKKSPLAFWEKLITGCALGMGAAAAVPFVLYLFGGVLYSYSIAVASVAILYAIAIFVFWKENGYAELQQMKWAFSVSPDTLASLLVILLVLANFWIRLQTYSPIFYELDPYFYTYGATQLLTLGETPFDDQTGWYPEARSSHRAAPLMIYMEAMWHSFYTGNAPYEVYLLSTIASVYPAIAAAFAVFFLYLFIRLQYGKEAGLVAGGMAGFVPMFLTKTLAGEMEVQPYGFFALAFFFAMYALAVKMKELRFAVVAGIAYAVIVLGSSSQIVAIAALLIFIPLQALLLFFQQQKNELFEFIKINAIVVVLGPLLSELLKNMYVWQNIAIIGSTWGVAGALGFAAVLYYIQERTKDREMATYAIAGLLLAGAVIVLYTPFGEPVQGVIRGGLGVASYTTALQRTIAEQGVSGTQLEGHLGFLAGSLPGKDLAGIVPAFITGIINTLFTIAISIANSLFGVNVEYQTKEPNTLFVVILLLVIASLYAMYRGLRLKESTLILLLVAALFPAAFIGILKEKFTVFTGFLMAGAVGIIVGEATLLVQRWGEKEKGDTREAIRWFPLLAALLLVYAQYRSWPLPHALLATSMQVRFQDDPLAVQGKLSYLCEQIKLSGGYDGALCESAAGPMEYASRSTNHQYDARLCAVALVEPPSKLIMGQPLSEEENWATRFRCYTRLNNYWIETMEWIAQNTEKNARITSWWDYGHWTNLFGQRNTVLRNEHLSLSMIGEVAHGYLQGTPEELRAFMKAHDSKYALFDQEIIFTYTGEGLVFGGKYGALNYLACARNNRTGVTQTAGISECEQEHLWELVYVPHQPAPEQTCVVSESAGITGTVGYHTTIVTLPDGSVQQQPIAVYCVAEQRLEDQSAVKISYYLDRKDPEGNLVPNKGLPRVYGSSDQLAIYTMYYTNDPLWFENGTVVGGYSDRKGRFYDSNLYRAFVLEELPGFELVFKSSNGEVKIFKIVE